MLQLFEYLGSLCFAKRPIPNTEVEEETTQVQPDQKELSVLGRLCLSTGVSGRGMTYFTRA